VSAPPLIVVVAFEAPGELAGCLSKLDAGDAVVVVDNSPSTATRTAATQLGAQYLASPANIGFAAAVNRALDEFWDGRRDVLLLNPDARISMTDVQRLQHALHEGASRLAAVGPRLVGFDGVPQRADWPVPSPAQVWLDALGLGRLWRGRRFVVGAVLMLNAGALAELGPFDERYFLYAEEADWQLRAQRAGWSVAVVDDVVAMHAGAASSSDSALRNLIFHASGEAFARRWYGRLGWAAIRAGSLVAAARRSMTGSRAERRLNRQTFGLYWRGPIRARESSGRAA
jgi:GT2 family glycosyltransferase